MVVLRFVRSVTFNAFKPLDSARKGCVSLPPAVFALEHTQVHVSSLNYGYIPSNIKAPIDEALSFTPALVIPNVYPDN